MDTQNTQNTQDEAQNVQGTVKLAEGVVTITFPVPTADALKANTKGKPFATVVSKASAPLRFAVNGQPFEIVAPVVNVPLRMIVPGTVPSAGAKRRFTLPAHKA